MSTLPTEAAAAVTRASLRVRDWAEHRLDQDVVDIARLYRRSRNTLVSRLRDLYDTHLAGDATLTRVRSNTDVAQALDRAISRSVEDLAEHVGQQSVDRLTAMLGGQRSLVNRVLGPAVGAVEDLPVSTQAVLAELTTSTIGGGTFFDRIFHVTDTLRQSLIGNLRTSLLDGSDFDTVRSRIYRTFGVDRLQAPGGSIRGVSQAYRNAARAAWNDVMSDVAEETGSLEVWWARLDDRTTPGCAARHGQAINEIGDNPPRHFNCRCTVAVLPGETDLEPFQRDSSAWLSAHGYSRRRALAMESEGSDRQWHPLKTKTSEAGWGWGASTMIPASMILATMPLDDRAVFSSIPWYDVPVFLSGAIEPSWRTTQPAAFAMAQPDHVLVAKGTAGLHVWSDAGWRRLDPEEDGPWIPVPGGLALDSPHGPSWLRPRRRLPLDIIRRWPQLKAVTFPTPGAGEQYAAAFVPVVVAERIARGERFEDEWASGSDLRILVTEALNRTPVLYGQVFAVARVPFVAGSAVAHVSRHHVDAIVDFTSGLSYYSRERYTSQDGVAPYTRVAIAVIEQGNHVWAIRPRGLPFWSLPGGHIDEGESLVQAAVREMREEAGLTVEIVASLGTLYRPWSNTIVMLGRREGGPGLILSPDEIDACSLIEIAHLAPDERLFLEHSIYQGMLFEQQIEAAKVRKVTKKFDPSKHPRGKKGTDDGGQFVKGQGGAAAARKAVATKAQKFPDADVLSALRKQAADTPFSISKLKNPNFTGKPKAVKNPFGTKLKHMVGSVIAESVAIEWLKSKGIKDARPIKPGGRNNYAVDLTYDSALVEVKGGFIGGSVGAQQWRMTSGEPSAKIKGDFEKMTSGQRAAAGAKMSEDVIGRKLTALRQVERVMGKPYKKETITMVIDPARASSGVADVYHHKDWHPRIGWNSPEAKKAYVGTVAYKTKA